MNAPYVCSLPTQIDFEYRPTSPQGSLGPPVTFGWDIPAGTVT